MRRFYGFVGTLRSGSRNVRIRRCVKSPLKRMYCGGRCKRRGINSVALHFCLLILGHVAVGNENDAYRKGRKAAQGFEAACLLRRCHMRERREKIRAACRLVCLHHDGVRLVHAELAQRIFHHKRRERSCRGAARCFVDHCFRVHNRPFSGAHTLHLYIFYISPVSKLRIRLRQAGGQDKLPTRCGTVARIRLSTTYRFRRKFPVGHQQFPYRYHPRPPLKIPYRSGRWR